jgi:hypothetical protein
MKPNNFFILVIAVLLSICVFNYIDPFIGIGIFLAVIYLSIKLLTKK